MYYSVKLCVTSVALCETTNYTELHREVTESHRVNNNNTNLLRREEIIDGKVSFTRVVAEGQDF